MMEILKMVCLIMWSMAGGAMTIGIIYSLGYMHKWSRISESFMKEDKI